VAAAREAAAAAVDGSAQEAAMQAAERAVRAGGWSDALSSVRLHRFCGVGGRCIWGRWERGGEGGGRVSAPHLEIAGPKSPGPGVEEVLISLAFEIAVCVLHFFERGQTNQPTTKKREKATRGRPQLNKVQGGRGGRAVVSTTAKRALQAAGHELSMPLQCASPWFCRA
jgi:hypothetical protein